MCRAKIYAHELKDIIQRANRDILLLADNLSDLDKEVNCKYHQIETTNFNAYEGFCFAKSLQYTLQKRRIVKNELRELEKLINTIKESNRIEHRLNKLVSYIKKDEESQMVYGKNFSVGIGDFMDEEFKLKLAK